MPRAKITSIAVAQAAGLRFLVAEQEADGCFLGRASASQNDFSISRNHYTPFVTSLIVNCLAGLAASESIRTRAAGFIASQRSADWSWNYWIRGSIDGRQRPYPDDLDDTVVALSALTSCTESAVSGEALGALGRLLVSQEVAVGGPYRSWLVHASAAATWRDTDIAVNANIGYLLSQHQVETPGLADFISQALTSGNLSSRYYDGPLPVLYFISRWYRGSALGLLQKLLERQARKVSPTNALHISLLVSASYHAGVRPPLRLCRQLLVLQQADGSWPAASLYFEPAIDAQPYYAGSAALTTAFALEALTLVQRARLKLSTIQAPVSGKRSLKISDGNNLLKNQHHYLQRLAAKDSTGQIKAIATITAAACQRPVNQDLLAELNRASLNGWASYTLFDNLLDRESDDEPSQLPLAMLLLRRTNWHFSRALPMNSDFQALVQQTLDTVDTANDWEQRRARATLAAGRLQISELPDYRGLQQLANRSLGHCLASCGVLVALGQPVANPEQLALRRFYRHYLIARQLHDDAHDWQEDLCRGRISAVVSHLLKGYFDTSAQIDFDISQHLPELKRYFWETTIETVIDNIERQLKLARRAITGCHIISQPILLTVWLDDLAAGVAEIRARRTAAQQFISAYIGVRV